MKNNILVGVIVAVLTLVGASFVLPREVVVKNTVTTPNGEQGLAGVSGPDRYFPRECMDGACMWFWSSGLRAATSSSLTNKAVCSYQVQATSTLVAATMKINANEAYANTFEIGIGTNGLATTTRLGIKTIAASVPGEIVASTTDAVTGLSGNVLIPGTYINFLVATGTPVATFDPTGKCVVVTREL